MTPLSQQIVAQAQLRFHQLKEYGFDWSSFYNGYLEGRVAGLPSLKEESHQRHLQMFGQFVLRLLLEEKDWDDYVQELIEDSAMDLGLIETDEKGDYRLTQAN